MFVVSGVTGNTGSVVAQTLLEAGHKVRVIVRTEEKARPWQDKGYDTAIATLEDVPALTKALEGATGAYLMLPPDLTHEDFITSRNQMADNLLQAAQTSNLPHAVLLSSVGAQYSDRNGPIKTLSHLERIFKEAAIPYTAVRPGYFLENWAAVLPAIEHDGVLPSFLHPLDFKIDMVATQDIGKTAALALIDGPQEHAKIIELKGADKYSAQDVATAFAKALKKDVTPIAVPKEDWVGALTSHGISHSVATNFAEMYENINNGHIDYENQRAEKGETSLERFIEKLVA